MYLILHQYTLSCTSRKAAINMHLFIIYLFISLCLATHLPLLSHQSPSLSHPSPSTVNTGVECNRKDLTK
jgi:hypothetical protein